MATTIELSEEQAKRLAAAARAEGVSLAEFLDRLARERAGVVGEDHKERVRSKTLLELFEPLRGLDLDVSRNPSTGRSVEL